MNEAETSVAAAESAHVREGWRLVCTCQACPEQYEIIDHQGDKKAYMRLRWGYFQVTCPGVLGDVVFEHTFEGDEYKGIFEGNERREFLRDAVNAVENWWRSPARAGEGR